MKIAILITGHLRTFSGLEQNFYDNVIKPNIDNNTIDIFFHTYFDTDNTSTFSLIKPKILTFEMRNQYMETILIEQILDIINYKEILNQ
jgi:hypothetical protein